MTTIPDKILYTAKVKTTGGRNGTSVSSDEKLKVELTKPTELGGTGLGTNPEQLFAAGYSACFIGAMQFVAGKENITLPEDLSIVAEVGFGPIEGGFGIQVAFLIDVPGYADAQSLVEKANLVCPYSNATHGNIEVVFTITN